eukprot:160302-Pelagomonas_calceolata.AAC.3
MGAAQAEAVGGNSTAREHWCPAASRWHGADASEAHAVCNGSAPPPASASHACTRAAVGAAPLPVQMQFKLIMLATDVEWYQFSKAYGGGVLHPNSAQTPLCST